MKETVLAASRVLERCEQLSGISDNERYLRRVYLSAEHAQVNALVAEWMREAGLHTWQDAAGNLCGRLEGREPGLPALVLGSHLDTVTDAGKYDGMLGVLLGIEVADRLKKKSDELPFAIEVVAFSDEEGTRFANALSGSRAFAGSWQEEWWELRDAAGTTLRDAFVEFGLDPERIGDAARNSADLVGYLEAHIEQGPYLEDADQALGVVTSIAGARRFELTMLGQAGHAGGTPYDRRRDALVGAAELVVLIERLGRESLVIATVGKLQVFPGGVNVIPGRVEFTLDLRAEADSDRDAAWDEILGSAQIIANRRGLEFTATETYRADAVRCAPALREVIAAGIQATTDYEPLELWSRAGHDGPAVSAVADFAMLFVRCAGGVSHHPDESVTLDDVAAALDAFTASVKTMINRSVAA
jgi:allantoate deiminase